MKKTATKTLSFVLAVLMVLCAAPLGGLDLSIRASAAVSGVYTYSLTDDEATITKVDKSIGGSVVIPAALGGYPVVGIGEHAFSQCNSITSVTIPESVKLIGGYAFYQCENLTYISIGQKVETIEVSAFEDCNKLPTVTIPESVTSIGTCAFGSCDSLYNISVDDANSSYSSAQGVLFDKDMKTILQFPEGISLTKYSVPASVTAIGDSAFFDCERLTEVTMGVSVTAIGSEAFYSCNALSSITLPDSVVSIGDYAFSWCEGLSGFTVPKGVASIGEGAFMCCTGLERVTIAGGSTVVGNYAFSNCSKLANISIPAGMVKISDGMFESCYSITGLTLPESVTDIGAYAFYMCEGLTRLPAAAGVTDIGKYAFAECENLKNITIPESVKAIEEGAFYGCTALKEVSVPKSVNTVGAKAFGYYDDDGDKKLSGFIIKGDYSTAAAQYAKNNSFSFIPYSGCPHEDTKKVVVKATCLKTGLEYDLCNVCSEKLNSRVLPLSAHVDKNSDLFCDVCKGCIIETKSIAGLKTSSTSSTVKLTWTAVPGSPSYRIYEYDATTKKYVGLRNVATNSVTITGLPSNSLRNYRVRAYMSVSGEYRWSKPSAVIKTYTAPAKASGLKVSSYGNTALKLTWAKVSGATGYRVYKYNPSTKLYEAYRTLTATALSVPNLTAGTVYYFKVRAYRTVEGVNYWGDTGDFLRTATRPANSTLSSAASTAAGKLTLKMTKPAGTTGFLVQYSTSKSFSSGVTNKYTSSSSPAFSGLKRGSTYYVRVRPFVLTGTTRVFSPAYSAVKAVKIK